MAAVMRRALGILLNRCEKETVNWEKPQEHPVHTVPPSPHPEAPRTGVALGCWREGCLYHQYSYVVALCCRLLRAIHFTPDRSILHPCGALFHRLGTRVQGQKYPAARQEAEPRPGIPS